MKRGITLLKRALTYMRQRHNLVAFAVVFAAIFLRYLSCGTDYIWQQDDYIQYINYPRGGAWGLLLLKEGLLASRPLAAITDLFVWSRFADCMMVSVFLLSALYAASALLFLHVFRRRFGTGWMFIVLYTLIPIGIEASYWISAASRLICGLFWCALSLWLLSSFVEDKRTWCGVLYFPVLLLAYGYYEQTLVLAAAASLLLMIGYLVERRPRALLALWTFAAAGIYFLFTSAFSDTGAMAARMQLALPDNPWYFKVFLPNISTQIWQAMAKGSAAITLRGFVRGAEMIAADGKWIWLILCVGLCVAHALLAHREARRDQNGTARGLAGRYLFGVLLTLAPVSIFFFIANPYFALRNALPAVVGLAFLGDLTLRLCLRRQARLHAVLCGVLAAVFCIASVSEMHDYRATYAQDLLMLDCIEQKIEAEDDVLTGKRIGIIGANATYLSEQNFYFNGHISGITASDWGLYGALVARAGEELSFTIVPLAVDEDCFWRGWNRDLKQIDGFDVLWYWDDETATLLDLDVVYESDGTISLFFAHDGSFCAAVWEEQEPSGEYFGYIRFAP